MRHLWSALAWDVLCSQRSNVEAEDLAGTPPKPSIKVRSRINNVFASKALGLTVRVGDGMIMRNDFMTELLQVRTWLGRDPPRYVIR